MRKHLLIFPIFILFISITIAQEIPNPGFENWDGATGDLIDWFENNPPTGPQPVFASLNSHSGMFSVALRVVEIGGFPFPPSISSGADGTGFPVTQRYEALNGYFEFTPQAGDFFDVSLQMWVGGITGTQIGLGFFSAQAATTDWTQFSVPINYSDPGTPDWCTVQIIVGINQSSGGEAVVDDLSFGSASSVELIKNGLVPDQFELSQNYPNPFNPSTTIQFSIPTEGFVALNVFNSLGEKVSTLVSESLNAGTYKYDWNASVLPSGIYFYSLTADNFKQTKKLVLMK